MFAKIVLILEIHWHDGDKNFVTSRHNKIVDAYAEWIDYLRQAKQPEAKVKGLKGTILYRDAVHRIMIETF